MVKSVEKGKRGEREMTKLLQQIVNEVYSSFPTLVVPQLERNLDQSLKGGHDIKGVDWLALEVKRHETLQVNQWWNQAVAQAMRVSTECEPVLLYRQNNRAWTVVMFARLHAGTKRVKTQATIPFESFAMWFRTRLEQEALKEVEALQ